MALTYQVVIRPDAKQFSEVAEGNRSVCFEAEIWEMVGWGEVAAFTEVRRNIRAHNMKGHRSDSQIQSI